MFGIKPKYIIITIFTLLLDACVYILLGLALMSYEDFYDESKGPFWSWESMNSFDKTIIVLFQLWNFINILLVVLGAIFVIKKIQSKKIIKQNS